MAIIGALVKRAGAYEDMGPAPSWVKVSGQYLPWDQPTVVIKASGVYDLGNGEAPTNLTPPVIAGLAEVGATLICTPGTWDGNPTPVITRRWYADGLPILGATGLTFVLTPSQAGHVVRCGESGTNTLGTASAPSNGIALPALTAFSAGFSSGFGA